MVSFSALLLAGGQSSRMGRDKALLPMPDSGLLLWQRQLRVLEELGPEKIIWSGPPRDGVPAHLPVVSDAVEKAGPLAGICAGLALLRSDFLVVLAIDLPQMTPAFLQSLLSRCAANAGAVARQGDFFEPLAAVYPKQIAPLAQAHLEAGRYAMQDLIREGVRQRLLQSVPLADQDSALFKNLNSPDDLKS